MTPKEKAKELVDKYYHLFSVELENTISHYESKHCALIAVDEILEEHRFDDSDYANRRFKYFQEVKSEINKL